MQLENARKTLPVFVTNLRRTSDHGLKRCFQSLRPTTPRTMVFVAGCQRSGTNMLMDLLDASYETDVYHEHDSRAFERYEMRSPEVLAQLRQRSRAPVTVVKAICDMERLPELCERFEPAKVLWIYRDFRDVVNSMLVSFRHQARQIQRLASGADDSWWGRGLSADSLALLRECVTPQISDASAAALQWYVRAVMFFELGHDQNPAARLLNYEALVRAPTPVLQDVGGFIGICPPLRAAGQVFGHSVSRRPAPAIAPHVEVRCLQLLERLHLACG